MTIMRRILPVLFVMLLLLTPCSMLSQQATTSVRGTILDVQGAAIQGATVDLIDKVATVHKTTTTDDKGEYQFQQVVPGEYNIEAG